MIDMDTRYPTTAAEREKARLTADCGTAEVEMPTLSRVSERTENVLREANATLDNLHERLQGHTIPGAFGDAPKPERPSVLEQAHDVNELARRVLDLSQRIAASI